MFLLFLCIVLTLCLAGCNPKRMHSNEELRLPTNELPAYRTRAENGDSVAAKKLWLHYSFAEQNSQEGKRWKAVYDEIVRKDPSKHVDD